MSTAGLDVARPQDAALPLRSAVFVAALLLVWVSTSPFKGGVYIETTTTSNLVNQLSFTGMAALGLFLAAGSGGRAALAYLRPSWILMVVWMIVGAMNSANPEISQRALQFTLVVLLIAGSIMLLPQGMNHFARLIGTAALIVLLISYAGLVVFRSAATHSSGDLFEPEHAGAWRGLFDHKNVAGAMMVIMMLIGIFVAQSRARTLGLVVTVLAALFLFKTGSKTSMALGPFVVLVGFACARIGSLAMRAVVALGPLVLLLGATIGSVIFQPLGALVQSVSPGQTFTGRTEIWSFALDRLWNRPWGGYGLEGFWGSPYVLFADIAEDETGIAQGMVHGHNGYLDLVIAFGIPGLIIAVVVLILLPLRDHHRVVRTEPNRAMAELFFRIWLFALYSACLESFFFRRADPVWFSLLLAVIGLRLTSRYRVLP